MARALRLFIRLDEQERQTIETAARRDSRTISDFVRLAALGRAQDHNRLAALDAAKPNATKPASRGKKEKS